MPDQVLGMIGGHNGVHLGKDADDRIRSGVYMAVKSSPSVGARGLAGDVGGRGAGGRNGGGGGAAPGGGGQVGGDARTQHGGGTPSKN